MGIKCISTPTITMIRDLATAVGARTTKGCQQKQHPTREPLTMILLVVLCLISGLVSQCSAGHSVLIAGPESDSKYVVQAAGQQFSDVLSNDVEELQATCER